MIRAATPADIPVIHALIRELADFEKALEDARATEEQLRTALFGPDPVAHALVAVESGDAGEGEGAAADGATGGAEGDETGEAAGEVVGFALWFRNFSTWTGTAGVYLEDLYVRPRARGAGHGKALLAALAGICAERGYARFEWSVLDWNDKALAVYRSIGALPQDEWTVQRLSGPALAELAAQAPEIRGAAPSDPSNRTPPHAR